MAMTIPTPNILLGMADDKLGKILIELKNQLVATGLWRVRASSTGGSGAEAVFQNMGQTAGLAGSFDVFTGSPAYLTNVDGSTIAWSSGGAGSISRLGSWLVLEEIASGRCLTVLRTNSAGQANSTTVMHITWSNGGVAASGATVAAPPAQVAPSVQLAPTVSLGADLALTTNAHWLQLAVSDASDAGNVCPFWWSVFNRTTGAKTWGMIYESLTDAPAGDLHPYVVGSRLWSEIFNDSFGKQRMYGGAALALRGFSGYHLAPPGTTNIPNISPATYTQPVGVDGFWRTYRPMVLDGAGVVCGRSKNFLLHPINREYPTTYGLAGADPRLALGQFLVPWKQGVVPSSTP